MRMRNYTNNVKERRCPFCGKKRPYDWYAPEAEGCWKCRAIKADEKEVIGHGGRRQTR